MVLSRLLEIPDIYTKVCPPNRTLMLSKTSSEFKKAMDNMGLEAHIHIKMSDCRKCYVLLKNISENYIITEVEFIKCNTYMFLDLDIINKMCPSLTHINLCNNSFCFLSLNRFKKNLPKCKVLSCHIRPPSSMRYDFDPGPMRLDLTRLHLMRLDPVPMRLDPLPMRLDPLPMRLDLTYSIDYQLKKRFSGRSLKSVDKVSKKLFRSAQHSSMKKIKQANCKK
jgi:hypothetical protein